MFIAGRIPGIIALTLAFACSGALAMSQSDRDVQTLGNFPALQKIASKDGGTLRAFVKRVSTAYSKAGYNDFGPEFRRSGGAIIAQFAVGASDDDLKAARSALRKLEQALGDDAFVVLPANTGSSLPDYLGLAQAFLESAKTGLKNVSLGKNVANSLRNNKGNLWLTKLNDDTFKGSLIGAFTYTGSTAISNGLLVISNASSYSTGATSAGLIVWDINSGGTLGGTGTVVSTDQPGTGTLILSGGSATYTGTLTIGYTDFLLSGAIADGGFVKTGAGTLILTGSNTYNGPINITAGMLQISSTTLLGSSTAELKGGSLTIGGNINTHWVAFLPEFEVPTEFGGKFHVHLTLPYTVNGVDLPTNTVIYRVNDDYVAPDDAITLSGPGLSATLTPTPTPTPEE
jgi:autotransporter-associated beta strand protein